eukprot:9444534-Alexandrium_andersonii.AAC.1
MSASLVGSEMCIRDRARATGGGGGSNHPGADLGVRPFRPPDVLASTYACLLYTSDAADDM